MIVIRVELWSAVTGEKKELARMHIANDGAGTLTHGDYDGTTFRGRDSAALDKLRPNRTGKVAHYPRKALHVWHLVARMLAAMEYG